MGMGYRFRNCGDYLFALQKEPRIAKATWRDKGIPSRWSEKVNRKLHPHTKPIGLIKRLIASNTEPGDLVIDPAAGSFTVMHAAHELERDFLGCDIAYVGAIDLNNHDETTIEPEQQCEEGLDEEAVQPRGTPLNVTGSNKEVCP